MKFWGATMSHHQPTAAATRSPAKMSSMSGRGATRPIRSLVFAALAPFVAGCAIHPLPDDVTRETTYSIVQKVRCEAQRGLLEGEGRWLRDGTVAYDFTFNINEKNGAGGGFTLTDPFKSGTFTLTGTAKADRTRLANRNFKVIDSFAELRATNCSQEALEKNWIYPLAGDVGMYEAIATFAKLQKVDNPEAGKLFTFADTLTFTTTFEGGLTGRVTLSPVTNRTDCGSPKAISTWEPRGRMYTKLLSRRPPDPKSLPEGASGPSSAVSVRPVIPFWPRRCFSSRWAMRIGHCTN
jgi:hypothetical protein